MKAPKAFLIFRVLTSLILFSFASGYADETPSSLEIEAQVVSMREGAARFYTLTDREGRQWVANTAHPGPRQHEAILKQALEENNTLLLRFRSDPRHPGSIAFIDEIRILAPNEISPPIRRPSFARIFRDHMVLQRDRPVPVWGFASSGSQIQIQFGDQLVEATTDEEGRWEASLEPLNASFDGETLKLLDDTGNLVASVQDVLVGEVWVLGGQSNMDWWLESSDGGAAAVESADYPWLRQFDPGWQLPDEPAADVASGAKWVVCSPETAGRFSAIGFWFAERLHKALNVPVGLLKTSVSGTYGESWVPKTVLESIPEAHPRLKEYKEALKKLPEETERWKKEKAAHEAAVAAAKAAGEKPPAPDYFVRKGPMGPDHFHRPYALFNGRIAPVAPYAARGAVWYQGEGNTQKHRAPYYDDILRGLLSSWRKAWRQPDMPFIIVQLPKFIPGKYNDWPMLREKQFEVAMEDPHTGLVTTIDLGDPEDIHPRDKEPVAERVARMASALAYGPIVPATGPLLKTVEKNPNGYLLTFSETGKGLRLTSGDSVKGFHLETASDELIPARARLTGSTTVELTMPDAANTITSIRYAAENVPEVNLVNSEGLPTAPFRFTNL